MGKEMIAAIAELLAANFGEEYTIYENEAQEEPERPCFFIELGHLLEKREKGRRYQRQYSFDIMCVPGEPGERIQLHQVGETLFDLLEWLEICGLQLEGRELSYEIVDGILNFHVTYIAAIEKQKDQEPAMESVELESRTSR